MKVKFTQLIIWAQDKGEHELVGLIRSCDNPSSLPKVVFEEACLPCIQSLCEASNPSKEAHERLRFMAEVWMFVAGTYSVSLGERDTHIALHGLRALELAAGRFERKLFTAEAIFISAVCEGWSQCKVEVVTDNIFERLVTLERQGHMELVGEVVRGATTKSFPRERIVRYLMIRKRGSLDTRYLLEDAPLVARTLGIALARTASIDELGFMAQALSSRDTRKRGY